MAHRDSSGFRVFSPALVWGACGILGVLGAQLNAEIPHNSKNSPVIAASHADGGQAQPVGAQGCVSCHQFEHGMSHPINVRPATTAAGLPLEGGMVTCLTCHDAAPDHRSAAVHVGVRTTGPALCATCHQSAAPGTKAIHALSIGKAHLLSAMPGGGKFAGASHRGAAGGLDAETRNCMGCHDGTAGMDAGAVSHRAAFSGFGLDRSGGGMDAGGDHPIGVPLVATERTRGGDFSIARTVDHRIRLFEGAIGCGSCHSSYSRESAQLVMSNQNSRLCLSCHKQ